MTKTRTPGATGPTDRVGTGIRGLDEVLEGGYVPGDAYLIRGPPGSGKTILGWHFLTAEDADSSLYISFEEHASKIERNARALGMDLDGVTIVDLAPDSDSLEGEGYAIFQATEVERGTRSAAIRDLVADHEPDRVFLDPVHNLRQLTDDVFEFRTQLLALLRFLQESGATVLYTSQPSPANPDDDLQFMSDGILELGQENERTIRAMKIRGSDFRRGRHTVRIAPGGLTVVPRIVDYGTGVAFTGEYCSSGVPDLDELLRGGLPRGTTTIISGPTGVGKTTAGSLFLTEAASRGEHALLYHFEESTSTFRARCEAINIPVAELEERGTLQMSTIEATVTTAGEFTGRVLEDLTPETSIVMIDGLPGYARMDSVEARAGGDDDGFERLHALTMGLKSRGITVTLTDEMPNITGEFQVTGHEQSYLADNIVFMRYLELDGEIRRAIGVLKMRTGPFERRLREFDITAYGVKVGTPLTMLRGILSGTPERVEPDGSGSTRDGIPEPDSS